METVWTRACCASVGPENDVAGQVRMLGCCWFFARDALTAVSLTDASLTAVVVMAVLVATVAVTAASVLTQRAGGRRSRSLRRYSRSSRGDPRRAAGVPDRAAGQRSHGICTGAGRRRQETARRPSTGLPRSGHCRSSCPTWAGVVSVEQFTSPGCGGGVAVMAAMWRLAAASSIRAPLPPQPALPPRR
jgi:hypothetical protein